MLASTRVASRRSVENLIDAQIENLIEIANESPAAQTRGNQAAGGVTFMHSSEDTRGKLDSYAPVRKVNRDDE